MSASGRCGEEVSINDERLMIKDGVHTENTEGYGCPQADEVGEQQLSKIGRQLKEKKYISTDDTEDTDVRKRTMWARTGIIGI